MSPVGYIFLHRKLMEWEWSDDPLTLSLFIRLLIEVNYVDGLWRGKVPVPAGSTITSVAKLSTKTGLTPRQIRTALSKLQSTSEVAIKTTNNYSMISIVKWGQYQGNRCEATNDLTNQTSLQTSLQMATIKEEKKKRRKEEEKTTNSAPIFFIHKEIKSILPDDAANWLSGKQKNTIGASKQIQDKWLSDYGAKLTCEQINLAYVWVLNNPTKHRKTIGQFISKFFKGIKTNHELNKAEEHAIKLMEKGYVD